MYCAMWLHYMKVYWHAQFTIITFFTHTHTWHVTLLPLQHPYSEGAPLLLHSVENISVAVAANLASNRNANVSQDGSMEAVFKTNHLGKEWIAGPSICSLHIHACKYTHIHTHTHAHAHAHSRTHTNTHMHTHILLPNLSHSSSSATAKSLWQWRQADIQRCDVSKEPRCYICCGLISKYLHWHGTTDGHTWGSPKRKSKWAGI